MADVGQALNNFFNAGANFTNAASALQQKTLEENARVDILNKNAQLEADTNKMFEEMQGISDPAQRQGMVDNLLQKLKDGTADPSSPYYCKNAYTAQKFNEIVTSQRNNLLHNVEMQRIAQEKQERSLASQNTLKYYSENMKGQDRVTAVKELASANYGANVWNKAQADQAVSEAVNSATMDEASSLYYEAFRKNPKASQADLEAAVKAGLSELDYGQKNEDGSINSEKFIDTKGAIQEGFKLAQTKIKQEQYENNNEIFDQNTRIREAIDRFDGTPASAQSIQNLIDRQKRNIKNLPQGTLNVNDYRQRLEELNVAESKLKLTGGAGGSVTARDLKLVMQDAGKYGNSVYMAGYLSSSEEHRNLFRNAVVDEVRNGGVKGLSPDATDAEIDAAMEKHRYILDDTFDTLKKTVLKDPRYASVNMSFENTLKDMEKNKDKYTPEAYTYLTNWMIDKICNTNINSVDSKEIIEEMQKVKSYCALNKAGVLFMNKDGESTYKKGWIENEESYIGKGAQSLMDNDVVMTDVYGKEKWTDQKSKDAATKIIEAQREVVGAALGINAENAGKLSYTYKRTDDNDMTPTPVWRYGNREVEVQPVDNGKSYQIIDTKTGEVLSNPNDEKKQREAAKRASQNEQRALEMEKRNLGNERLNNQIETVNKVTSVPPAVKAAGYKWEKGKMTTSEEKETVGSMNVSTIKAVIQEIQTKSKKGEKAFKALKINMSITDFNKLSEDEKTKIILGL